MAREALLVGTHAGSSLEQARAYATLARTYVFKSDLAGLMASVEKGIPFAAKAGNDTISSDLYNLASLNYRFKHQPDSALEACKQAERYARRGRMDKQLGNVLLVKAALYNDKRNYQMALKAYQESYRIDVKLVDTVSQAMDLANIGAVLANLEQPHKALLYYRQALPLQQARGDSAGAMRTNIAIGNVWLNLSKWDSANRYMTHAYAMASQLGDVMSQGAIANNQSLLFGGQGELVQMRFWLAKSIEHYFASGDSARAASPLGNLAEAEIEDGEFVKAESHLNQAIALGNKLGENKILSRCIKALATVYDKTSRPALASQTWREYATLQDTLYRQNLTEEIANLQGRHEAFVKDQQISLLNRNLEVRDLTLRQKDLLLQRRSALLGMAALLAMLVAGIIFFVAKKRRLEAKALSERLARQEQERHYLAELAAEETERKRIARELHDGLGQMLAGVRLNLAARSGPGRDLSDIETMLEESSQEVRYISHNLMPQALERQGIDSAVEEFCGRIQRTKKLAVHASLEPVGDYLNIYKATVIYRVMQELVANTLKHAEATELYVSLALEEGQVVLTVEDNGIGFEVEMVMAKGGIGLANLASRMAQAGGQIDYESAPGRGALVLVRVPALEIDIKAEKQSERKFDKKLESQSVQIVHDTV